MRSFNSGVAQQLSLDLSVLGVGTQALATEAIPAITRASLQ